MTKRTKNNNAQKRKTENKYFLIFKEEILPFNKWGHLRAVCYVEWINLSDADTADTI